MSKMIVIGDELTVMGMKFAGLKDCITADENTVEDAIRKVPGEFDIIVMSAPLYKKAKGTLARLKEKMVIELPDKEAGGEDMVARMIRDVIGFDTSANK